MSNLIDPWRSKPNGMRKLWTKEEEAQLRAIWQATKKQRKIYSFRFDEYASTLMDRDATAINAKRQKLRLVYELRRAWDQERFDELIELFKLGRSDKQIGKVMGVKAARIMIYRSQHGLFRRGPRSKLWKKNDQTLRTCVLRGLSASQAALMIGQGVTRNACISRAARLGLHFRSGQVRRRPCLDHITL